MHTVQLGTKTQRLLGDLHRIKHQWLLLKDLHLASLTQVSRHPISPLFNQQHCHNLATSLFQVIPLPHSPTCRITWSTPSLPLLYLQLHPVQLRPRALPLHLQDPIPRPFLEVAREVRGIVVNVALKNVKGRAEGRFVWVHVKTAVSWSARGGIAEDQTKSAQRAGSRDIERLFTFLIHYFTSSKEVRSLGI